MAVTEDTFLADLVTRVIGLLEIKDSSQALITANANLLIWAKQVNSAVEAYCNRPFMQQSVVERYPNAQYRTRLRVTPVSSVAVVRLVQIETDLAVTSYHMDRNELILDNILFSTTIGFDEELLDEPFDIRVTYTGGYAKVSDDRVLLGAMADQLIYWWHQKDIMGLSQISGPAGVGKVASNSEKLTDVVMIKLAKFIYPGEGYEE